MRNLASAGRKAHPNNPLCIGLMAFQSGAGICAATAGTGRGQRTYKSIEGLVLSFTRISQDRALLISTFCKKKMPGGTFQVLARINKVGWA
jgi:hypothetical protein